MASIDKYKFLLDGLQVFPVFGDEMNYDWEKETDSFYFRQKLGTQLKFTGNDFLTIESASIEHQFIFKIQKLLEDQWIDDFTGYFFKTDCDFDPDYKRLTVKPTSDDGYENMKKVMNAEVDLIKLNPIPVRFTYFLRPIHQVIVAHYNGNGKQRIYNFYGTHMWIEELTEQLPDYTTLINTYGFSYYASVASDGFALERYITPRTTFDGVATIARPANDVSTVFPNYKYINAPGHSWFNYYETQNHTTTPTKWGQIIDSTACPGEAGKYYVEPVNSNAIVYPTEKDVWDCWSRWLVVDDNKYNFESENSSTITINESYKLSNVIAELLEGSGITHQATEEFSEFLYKDPNPITGLFLTMLITPKSNIKNLFYTRPAMKAKIRLSDITTMLRTLFNVYWHIETVGTEKRLRFEHINWYRNGGSYSGQLVDLDTTLQRDKRNGLPLSYYQNKYSYNKNDMPQRYEFGWMDNSSEVFTGSPIEVVSNQVEPGNMQSFTSNLFTADLDIIVSDEGVSLDGFAVMAAELDFYYVAPKVLLNVKGVMNIEVQNGYLAYRYLHPTFWRYNMPAVNLKINDKASTALSIQRNKKQNISFAYEDIDIDPLHLIKTELGSGQVEKMSLNLVSNKYTITLNHDTE